MCIVVMFIPCLNNCLVLLSHSSSQRASLASWRPQCVSKRNPVVSAGKCRMTRHQHLMRWDENRYQFGLPDVHQAVPSRKHVIDKKGHDQRDHLVV